ncbi:MAG: AMP-binding protein [Acidimicrobiia bacterium]
MIQTGPETTVLDALAARLMHDPDGPYLDFDDIALTARAVDDAANRIAHGLADLGVGRGDRVATLLENSPEQVISFFAALKLGAVQVPINTAYKGEFLRHVLADSGAGVIVAQGSLASRVAEVCATDPAADLPELRAVVVAGPTDAVISTIPTIDWQTMHDAASDGAPGDPGIGPADLACFIYTAGTTGPSKGCMLPHHYVVALAEQIARAWQRRSDDIVLTPLPLFHFNAISVCVVGTLVTGGSAAIVRKFSVSRFWSEVKRTDATMLSMLGSLAILVANADDVPEQVGHRLRLCAAAPIPPDTDRIWRERFGCATFSAGYGLTEASLISLLPAGTPNRPGSAGQLNDEEFEVRLVDDDDREVAVGEIGEIVCRPTGPNLMFSGYWRRAEATVDALRNLWFHTGDLGRLDEDGFLYFVDRKKDYLRRRGENISSFEMERTFVAHPAIKDVAVHAVASEQGEDDVKVTAVLQEGATVTEEELCRWSVDQVPYFAVPRYIEFRSDLPRNPVGRVLKYELRDDGVTDATWDREASNFTFDRR